MTVKHTQEFDEQARDLWDQGISLRKIAAIMGVTPGVVEGVKRRRGFAKRPSTGGWAKRAAREQAAPKPKKAAKAAKPTAAVVALVRSAPIQPATEGCRWPIGTPRTKGFHFCGKNVARGTPHNPLRWPHSYCEEHRKMAYIPRGFISEAA